MSNHQNDLLREQREENKQEENSMNQNTPYFINAEKHTIVDEDGRIIAVVEDDFNNYYQAKAEFIVRAVNTHDDLLDALEELLKDSECTCIDFLSDKCRYCIAKNALAKAGVKV